MQQPDRRGFLRVEADLAALCTRLGPDGQRESSFTARTQNLSAAGAKLAAGETVSEGEQVWLELTFARPRFLVFATAEVVRVEPEASAFAVRFVELDQYVQQRVVRWVYAEDRRQFEQHAKARIPLRIRIICRRLGPEGVAVEELAAPSVDISPDGVRIVTDRLLPEGASLELELPLLDGGEGLVLRAVVGAIGPPDHNERRAYDLRFTGIRMFEQRLVVERALQLQSQNDQ
jgi:hypothetical protein